MKQNALPNVGKGTCHSILYFVIFCHHPVETFSVWEVRGRFFALDGILHNWAPVFQCKCQVWDYITLLMQTLHPGQCWVYTEAGSGQGDLKFVKVNVFLPDYMITVLRLYYGENPLWMSSSVNMFCSDGEPSVWE